jgi:membrane fusion protein, multidrug efflux system
VPIDRDCESGAAPPVPRGARIAERNKWRARGGHLNRLMQESIRAFCIWSQRKAWFSLSPELNEESELVDFAGPSVARTIRVLQRVLQHPANWQATVAVVALLAVAGCGESANQGATGANSAPEVGYVVVTQVRVPLTIELSGRTSAYQTSEVRPQVSGIIRQRFFTEGSVVKAGDKLYQIDPSLYRATVDQVTANLASARASAEAARMRAERYRPLAELEAVSRQDLTDAESQAEQAQAAVAQLNAQLETARINLRYTEVSAPISGHIGRSLYTVGALVTANQSDPLAVIQTLNPIFVDIQQSSADLLALRRSLARDGIVPARAEVELRLEDGSEYGQIGTVEFAEAVVNESTGTVTLRARLPNPQEWLLPGMFVRATFAQAVDTRAFLVPQAGLTRDPKGNATVWLVGPDDHAVQRSVTAERTSGSDWVVTAGLRPGDKVIVEGTGKVKANQSIRPVASAAVPDATPREAQAVGAGAAESPRPAEAAGDGAR